MDWDVVEVRVVREHVLHVRFRDGVAGLVRFESSFFSGVFESLRNPEQFREAQAPDGFVTWPSSNADLAPDAMHDAIKNHHEMVLK